MNTDLPIFVLVVVRLLLGLMVLGLARKGARTLYWLAAFFLIGGVGNLFATVSLSNDLFFRLGGIVNQFLILVFVERSFFQDRPSPFKWLFGGLVVFSLIGLALTLTGQRQLYRDLFFLGNVALAWGWHLVVAYQAYRPIAKEELVEDWVKARYQLMMIYSVTFIITNLVLLLRDPSLMGMVPVVTSLASLLAITTLVLQYLTWGMPEPFRKFLNRNYRAPAASEQAFVDLSEEELMKQLSHS